MSDKPSYGDFWSLAVAGMLAMWLTSKLKPPAQHSPNSIHPQGSTQHQRSQAPCELRPIATIESHPPALITGQQKTRKKRKNFREWGNFVAQWLTALVAGGLLIVTSKYALYTYNMWREMQAQTQVQRDAAINSERPWIKLIDVQTRGNGPIIPALSFQHPPVWPKDTEQTTFQLDISYQNVGHSVARVTVDFNLFLETWTNGYGDRIIKETKRYCDSVVRVNRDLSVIAYPGDAPLHWYGGGSALVTPDKLSYFSDRKPGVGYIIPVVSVCVSYQFGDNPRVYQTRALYEVFRKDDRTRFFEAGVGAPAKRIFLLRNAYADEAN